MKGKYQRRKLGNVYAIPLPDGKFAFGRTFKDAGIAVYKHIGKTIEDLPTSEDYQFIVGVYRDVLTSGDWPVVENRPFENEEDAWPPPQKVWDCIKGKYSLYHKGEMTPSTKAICKNLETCAVWDAHHIVDRIMGDDKWTTNASREQNYIQRYGQEAFDEFTKDS